MMEPLGSLAPGPQARRRVTAKAVHRLSGYLNGLHRHDGAIDESAFAACLFPKLPLMEM